MVKLAGTLVEDKLEEGIVVGKVVGPHVGGTGTLAQEINPVDGSLLTRSNHSGVAGVAHAIGPWVPAGSAGAGDTLGIHQIDIGEAEERIVGLSAGIDSVGGGGAVVLEIAPLLGEVSGRLIGHAAQVLALRGGEELAALVATGSAVDVVLGELVDKLRTQTEGAPSGAHAEVCHILVGIGHAELATHEIGGATPADGMCGRNGQRKNDFIGALVVVGIEELAVVALQTVAHVHNLLAGFLAGIIFGNTGKDLAVEIEFGKQGISCTLRGLTVRTGRGRQKVGNAVAELALDIVESLLGRVAWWDVAAHGVVFGHHRNIAVEVERMIIEERTHEAYLGSVFLHLRLVVGRETRTIGIAQKLVAEGDVVVDAVVHI